MRIFHLIGGISNSNMAASSGKKRHKSTGSIVFCVCLLLNIVPYCQTFSLPTEKLTLNVPHTARKGFTVLKTDLNQTCIEIDHIHRSVSNRPLSHPFTVQNDGRLVIKTAAYNFLGDLFAIRPKKSKSCQGTAAVSQTSSVYVEIVYSNKTLHFVGNDRYSGSIHEHAPVGSKVNGIQHLYACSAVRCSNNLEYRIVGSNNFYLETISKEGHVELEIYTKRPLQSGSYTFMIIAQNSDGLQGHTSIEVKVTPVSYPVSIVADESLYFSPRTIHRHKRATQETLTARFVDERSTGVLFSVGDPTQNWKYGLSSSTYQNAFTVSETGVVSVAPNFELDYETLTADGGSNQVQLLINVIEISDETLVKELIQPVIIKDINDEPPVFTNIPTPFLAAVSMGSPPNDLVYTLTAADPDAGANLSLALSQATSSEVNSYFLAQIQGNTAAIYRIGNQQFTENEVFRMIFIATDNAAPEGTTQRTTAEVQILAGSRRPQFMKNTYSIDFEEKNVMDQVIATVEVYSFQENPVTFKVLDNNLQESRIFGTEPAQNPTGPIKGCHIKVMMIMDYETPPRTFNVKIRAQEDNTGLFTDKNAVISVTDNNEFDPRFNASTYKAENTRENIAIGSALITFAASDEDFNTRLTFTVDNDHFRVEANNPSNLQMPQLATIYVNKKLDYDRISPKNYDFHVRAIDDGEIRRTGEATVRIFMTNVNDEAPVFPDPMTADIRYDADVGQLVTIIQATDADQGDTVSYDFDQTYTRFDLEASTGRITLQQVIPANTESFVLRIRATDDGGCCDGNTRLSSTGTLTVNIITDNLNRPEFKDCLNYQPEVSEEREDEFVIQVTATDDDIGSNGRVTYSIRESNSKFRINSTTGELYTDEKIDREALGVSKTVPVNIIATDGGKLQGTCSLLVKILDINDNPPIFVTQTYTFPVAENSPVDSSAAVVEATDADSGLNGEVTYSFTADGNPGGYFKFDSPSFTGQIKVDKTLQQDAEITLKVKATDRGNPPLSSNVTVVMRVTSDPNELPPLWSIASYTATVNESIGSSMNILTFSAESKLINNVELAFRVVDQNSIFETIDKDLSSDERMRTGYLRLKQGSRLDFETTESYSLTLRASDVNDVYADQRVTVIVTDTNDNSPEFVGTNPQTGFLDLSLLEGDYINTRKEVGRIRAIDNDKNPPNNQIVRYYISESKEKNFTIDSSTGLLYTQDEFDREDSKFRYTIIVAAVDGAPSAFENMQGQPNTGTVKVKVTIEDVNDNPPSFPQDSYTFECPEDLPIGDRLPNNAKVTATDPDSAAVLTYSVSPSPGTNLPPPFSIQAQTGALIVAGALDFDKGPQHYDFVVNVFDSIHRSSTNVTINIKNVNDNSPVVGNYLFDKYVEEDPNVLGPIATVNASDIDGDIDGDGFVRFWYVLKFTDAKDSMYFEINEQTGVLSIIKPLDRDYPDGKAEFIFTVEVADEDPNDPNKTPRYGFGEVVVKPIDINDNAPIFPEEARQMTVMENQVPGTLVGRVEVIDYDEGINAEFDLTILRQEPSEVFTLDGLDLKTTAKLDREEIDKYFVTMQAIDKGPGRNNGTGILTITVGDENDNKPFFNQTYSFFLSEHQTSGEFGRVKAYDLDIGPNADLTYTLANKDTVYFRMDKDKDNNEGVLKVYQPVDYDDIANEQRNFNLTAYAVDPDPGLNNEKRAHTFIEVIVTDYNDEVPKFEPREKSKDVAENAAPGTILDTFTATDRDVNEDYKKFEYYISRKSDPTRRFAINQDGEVRILNPLDRETTATHILHILAIDNVQGSPQNTGTATFTITVTDINDNCPDFAQDYSKTVSIMENQDFSDNLLVTISATDADLDTDLVKNGHPFSFERVCTDKYPRCEQFRVTQDNNGDNGRGTATIHVSGTFDREDSREGKTVSLPIKMCDLRGMNRGDQQCCTRILKVTIQDKNDNPHDDGHQDIVVYNYKGMFGDIKIGKVNANDPDDMDTDKVFTPVDQELVERFVTIDPATGEITLKPRVPEISFTVEVRVQDQSGLPPTQSFIRIHIIYVTEDALYNSGSIRIDGISPEEFVFRPLFVGKKGSDASSFEKSMLQKFHEQLAKILYGPDENDIADKLNYVQIISVMGDETHTDVRFAAHGSPYYQSSRLNGIVTGDKTEFENLLQTRGVENNGTIVMVPIDMCQFETCEGGCYNKLVVKDSPIMYNTKGSSYVGVDTSVEGTCGCRATTFPPTIECTPGYCYHGGVCSKNDWGVVSCDCPSGFEGPRCQKLRQSFNGEGYALYKPLEQCEESRTSIEFMTRKGTALILYNGPVAELEPSDPTDFLLLELVNGKARLRINHGTGEIQMSVSGGKNLNDGAWHRIDIFRDKKNVRMVVDHCVDSTRLDRSDCEASGVTRGENIYINVGDVLQLGGRLSNPSYPANVLQDKFDGCMKNLIHNREVYDLSTGDQFPGAKDGCDIENDACPNGCDQGQCLVTGVSNAGTLQATCICNPGYRKTSLNGPCDKNTTQALFKTQSYMDWEIKNTFKALLNSRKMTVSFHFRTRDTDGLMFYVSHDNDPNKYILFKIVSSKLQVSYNLGDDAYNILLSNVPNVADGYWHTVTLERYGKEFILKMDSGEGRYYTETLGPVNGAVDFTVRQDQIYGGASLSYSANSVGYNGEDFENSCLNDIRYDHRWFPMQLSENSQSYAADLEKSVETELGCDRNLCTDTVCSDPFVCKDLWGDFSCVCKDYYIKSGSTCVPIDYCADGPCFGPATCSNNVPPTKPGDNLFKCDCKDGWEGPLCQCHPKLHTAGEACEKEPTKKAVVGIAGGLIAGIVLGVLFLIVAVIIIVWLLWCRKKPADKEPFDEDMDDDIRENIMYYDEEGAGEEDHTHYDLSRLRKPDTGEHPSTWDAPDIRKQVVKPVGSSADRPEVGDFIHNRLNDADDDPNSPPYDTPHDFNFEGGSSDAGSLSSLNTSSSGSQDYDYLNEWGPKFAKLADMYNNYDDAE